MNLNQIIIFIILGVLWAWSTYLVAIELNHSKSSAISFLFSFIIQLVFITFSINGIIEMNKAKKENERKCPEYEKIENVYKLKE